MKKLLFSAYSLDIGGIEKSLVTLLNELQQQGYHITLVLEHNEGIFKKELDSRIQIVEYKPYSSKNPFIQKMKNFMKQMRFKSNYQNQFDFSACYATYSLSSSFIARTASSCNVLWIHGDYWEIYHHDVETIKAFFHSIHIAEFKKLIFVSQKAKDHFLSLFPKWQNKVMVCHNFINQQEIEEKAKIEIKDFNLANVVTFVNVGRQSEIDKKLSRLIEAAGKLKKDGYSFYLLLIGEGPDTYAYQEKIKEKQLEDTVFLMGKKENPYPYMLLSDCIVLCSEYEGYPVVFNEALVLNKPIITTDVSESKNLIEGKYGLVVEKSAEAIYQAMKQILEKGYSMKEPFSAQNYNEQVKKQLTTIIEEWK